MVCILIFQRHTYQLPSAKLAISIARKMNALIFLVPEDIVDIRPRLVSLLPTRRGSDC